MRFDGKAVIVTGGAQGIGRAVAERFHSEGASVLIADMHGAEEAAAAVSTSNLPVYGVTCNIAQEADTAAMAAACLDHCGRIDVLVNNAGMFTSLKSKPFEELSVDEWRAVLDVNVIGQFLACKAVTPAMRSQGSGRIINISSGTAFKGNPFKLHYVTSKGAVNAFTKALAKELGGTGILVNAVAPGYTLSDGVMADPEQMARLSETLRQSRTIQRDQYPEDLTGAIAFLASDDAAFMTGQTMVVDGGSYFH